MNVQMSCVLSCGRWPAWRLLGLMLIAAFANPAVSRAQISPGKLSRAHSSLEGATQCVQCHSLSRAPMATSCLNCHKDVKAMLDDQRGYHAKLPAAQRTQCASCHPDHAGVEFALIQWPAGGKNRFDHRQAGWGLDGKHAGASCESCHTTQFRTDPAAALSKRRSGTPWIGLDPTCASCHKTDDIHRGELKGGCHQCHDAKAWSPAPTFDHAKSRYPLTGKHVDVACADCHAANTLPLQTDASGKKIPLYRPVASNSCTNCHTDPHQGRVKGTCQSCHSTSGWDSIETRGFNHNATRYPLAGRHTRVECARCHGKNNDTPTPAFSTCAGCHADVHRGEAGRARDCAACHKVAGFSPATFTVAEHAQTGYALTGRHATTACAACHTATGNDAAPRQSSSPKGSAPSTFVRLKMPSASCNNCHEDAHAGQPAARNAAGGCAACHSVEGFTPSTMTAASHRSFRFTLTGAHTSAVCAACHRTDRLGLLPLTLAAGRAGFVFATGETACASCHSDPHAGRYSATGARPDVACLTCHSANRFRPSTLSTVDHAQLGYRLEGAHRAVQCVGCHRELTAPAGNGSLRLSATGVPRLLFAERRGATCRGCHAESHGTQFAHRKDNGACESCHTVERFAGAEKFDHDTQSAFSLRGAHAAVPCARCHPLAPVSATAATGNVSESARRMYTGVPTRCEGCHTAKRTTPAQQSS